MSLSLVNTIRRQLWTCRAAIIEKQEKGNEISLCRYIVGELGFTLDCGCDTGNENGSSMRARVPSWLFLSYIIAKGKYWPNRWIKTGPSLAHRDICWGWAVPPPPLFVVERGGYDHRAETLRHSKDDDKIRLTWIYWTTCFRKGGWAIYSPAAATWAHTPALDVSIVVTAFWHNAHALDSWWMTRSFLPNQTESLIVFTFIDSYLLRSLVCPNR